MESNGSLVPALGESEVENEVRLEAIRASVARFGCVCVREGGTLGSAGTSCTGTIINYLRFEEAH